MNAIEQGQGILFADPDPDAARAFFRTKSRRAVNKVMALSEAISRHVQDGDYLAIGGFGANRTPMAACHEIVRQGRKNMGFAGHTATHDMQILSAGKVYNRLDVAYVVGLEARGLSKCSRSYVESGDVQVTEWTNYALTARLQAAAQNVPFMATRNMMGTDTFTYFSDEDHLRQWLVAEKDCGFELLKADTVQVTDPPAGQELDILRHQVDPYG